MHNKKRTTPGGATTETQCEEIWNIVLGYIHISIKRIIIISIPHGLMARIPGFHPGGPGSIPGVGELPFLLFYF